MVTSAATRPRRTRAVDVERVLLEAGHRLLEREGVDALTVRGVAAEAGVAPTSLYHRFHGKHGLIAALFVDGFEMLIASLHDRPPGDALNELRAGCIQYRRFALANRALYAVMFERAVPGFDPDPDGDRACDRCFEVLATAVRRAQAAGAVRTGDPVEFAQQIWSACHGAVSLELRDIGFADDRDAFYDNLLSTLLAGLAPPEPATS